MIAISYRREDSLPIAGRLYDRLQAKFGKKNVFMDFDSIPPGADFRQHIKQMIERSNLVIAIIGPHWLGEQPDASRRIDNPADFVRLEIGYALEAGIPVIPLLINTTQMPKPETLPPDIQELAFRHALPLDSGMDFHSHTDRLIVGIGKATDAARRGRRFVTDSEKTRPGAPTTHEPRTSFGSEESKPKLITWTESRLVVGTSVALLFAVAALVAWYVSTHQHEQAKQVATANESNGPSAESARTPLLIVKSSVEPSSPLPLASVQPQSITEQSPRPQIPKAPKLNFASITKEHPYVNSLGMKFVPVPSTEVLFSVWDTRTKDYRVFADATKHDWPKTDFKQTEEDPAVNVSWNDATAFCKWLTEKEQKAGLITVRQSYRLPSDLEWSTAVGKSRYPWGDEWPPPQGAGNYAGGDDGFSHTSPVGNYKPNRFGLYDMGGNVWQWCEDQYRKEMNEKVVLDKFPALKNDVGGDYRVVRGSSWNYYGAEALLSSYRDNPPHDYRNVGYGFRCVLGESEIVSTKDEKSSAPLESLSPSATPNRIDEQKLTRAYVKKYGFWVLLPTELFPDAATKLADDEIDRLESVKDCASVAFNVSHESVKKAFDKCITEFRKEATDATIDYKVVKDTWFVVSGGSNTTGYYTKGVKRGDTVIIMQLEYKGYKGSVCNIPNAMLTEMSRKFDGN